MPRREPKQRHDSNTPVENRDLWRTPPALVAAVKELWPLGRDVASSTTNRVVERNYTEADNALVQSWELPAGLWNWCNPPYSNPKPWAQKLVETAYLEDSGTVMLVPQDFSIQWARWLVCEGAQPFILINGRVDFISEETGLPVNQNNKGSVLWVMDPANRGKPQGSHYIDLPSMMARGQHLLENPGALRLPPCYITRN